MRVCFNSMKWVMKAYLGHCITFKLLTSGLTVVLNFKRTLHVLHWLEGILLYQVKSLAKYTGIYLIGIYLFMGLKTFPFTDYVKPNTLVRIHILLLASWFLIFCFFVVHVITAHDVTLLKHTPQQIQTFLQNYVKKMY